jgi:calnexin
MIKNPKYKGKWSAPLIDNPEYKGEWKPRKIANPNYFEDLTPSNFGKIGAVGFELWSMQDGFLFDNIYIGHSENDAATLAKETWAVKKEIEKAKEPEPPKESAVDQAKSFVEKAKRELSQIPDQVVNFIDIAKVDPVDAVKTLPHIFTIIILSILLPVYLITSFFTKAKAPKVAKKEKAQESPKKEESKAKSSAVDSPKATKRNTKKD